MSKDLFLSNHEGCCLCSSTAFLPIHFPAHVSTCAYSSAPQTLGLALLLFPPSPESGHSVLGQGLGPCSLPALCADTAHSDYIHAKERDCCCDLLLTVQEKHSCLSLQWPRRCPLWCITYLQRRAKQCSSPRGFTNSNHSTLFSLASPSLS